MAAILSRPPCVNKFVKDCPKNPFQLAFEVSWRVKCIELPMLTIFVNQRGEG